ncbi:MAG: hypothetical protein ACKO4T_10725 [Planctomycetaceae bacterium]
MPDGVHPPSPIERLIASRFVRSTYTSLLAHLLVLILLAILMVPVYRPQRPRLIEIAMAESDQDDMIPGDAGGGAAGTVEIDLPADPLTPPSAADHGLLVPPLVPIPTIAAAIPEPQTVEAAHQESARDAIPAIPASLPSQSSATGGSAAAEAFLGRRGPARGEGVLARGGSQASEDAVEAGLDWLATHQAADGSWRFDLSGCRCDGSCRDPGTVASTTAATGIALLPFLGAGHTHLDGSHRDTVNRGIYYLMSRMRPTPRGGDLSEGTMYGHGVATLALAEVLGMTRDPAVQQYVRDAVRFIETAQDLHGGGWRYLPGQPGDTTVTGWQLAALKSASLAGVAVPSPTLDGVHRFLDRVQVRRGEAYGYQSPQARPCTSAIGLLCRLYTGWPDEATIDRGLTALAAPGPDPDAIYLNFYLSQALLQRDHRLWKEWNDHNRDQLVARQARHAHEAGSWFLDDEDTAPGGRLAHTALAVLTLEVYYRLLPIYGADAVAGGW